MAKREITARKAKENLEAYGYTGNAKWAEIDNFIRLNPEAKMALLANEGALVQSERLGFSNGGGSIFDPADKYSDIKSLEDARAKFKSGDLDSSDTGYGNVLSLDDLSNVFAADESSFPGNQFVRAAWNEE